MPVPSVQNTRLPSSEIASRVLRPSGPPSEGSVKPSSGAGRAVGQHADELQRLALLTMYRPAARGRGGAQADRRMKHDVGQVAGGAEEVKAAAELRGGRVVLGGDER